MIEVNKWYINKTDFLSNRQYYIWKVKNLGAEHFEIFYVDNLVVRLRRRVIRPAGLENLSKTSLKNESYFFRKTFKNIFEEKKSPIKEMV